MQSVIYTEKAPKAIGPYSQAVRYADLLFVSGQIPLDPETGEVKGDDVSSQARLAMKNLTAVLEAGGSSLSSVLKTTCYLVSMDDFSDFNDVYTEFFGGINPARACVAVSALPKGVKCEIEAVAACVFE